MDNTPHEANRRNPHMTKDLSSIKSVAIIGGGPSGIAALYETTRALKSGKSLFGSKDISEYEKRGETVFDEIVLFERNPTVGGVWSKSVRGKNNVDPAIPDLSKYDGTPDSIFIKHPIDTDLEKQLADSTYDKPVERASSQTDAYEWRSSAAYEKLYTNVPNKFMSFSFHPYSQEQLDSFSKDYKLIPHFQDANDLGAYLDDAVHENNLSKYIRTNSNVERVRKIGNKWEVITRDESVEGKDRWYRQLFDGVIIGNGKTVPVIPVTPNLEEFAKKSNVVLAKSIKDPDFLKESKKILFIGSNVSSIDLIQYVFPRDTKKNPIYVSHRGPVSEGADWVNFCLNSAGITNKPLVVEYLPETRGARFSDGTVVNDIDTVVIATGYHTYFPFLDSQDHSFYKWTFDIQDPSLALTGNLYAGLFFNRVETQGAAIAGIWSGATELPSKQEQERWYREENANYLSPFDILPRFFKPLQPYALEGRPFPLEGNDNFMCDLALGMNNLVEVFYKVHNGEITADDIV